MVSLLTFYFGIKKSYHNYLNSYSENSEIETVYVNLTNRVIYESEVEIEKNFSNYLGLYSPLKQKTTMQILITFREFPFYISKSTPETGKSLKVENPFTTDEIEKIKNLKNVKTVWTPSWSSIFIQQGNFSGNFLIFYINSGDIENFGLKIKSGRDFNKNDGVDKCIIGSKVKELIFPDENPIGKKLNYFNSEIIGVLEEKEPQSIVSGGGPLTPNIHPNMSIYFPKKESFTQINDIGYTDLIIVTDFGKGEEIKNKIKKIFNYKENNETILTVYSTIQNISHNIGLNNRREILSILFKYTFLLLIGSILVSGFALFIEVMTRTREISIRRALGTPKRRILFKYIINGILISTLSWFFSIVIFLILKSYMQRLLNIITSGEIFSFFNLQRFKEPLIPYPSLIEEINLSLNFNILSISLILMILIGVVFSIYPSLKASNIKPVFGIKYRGGVINKFTSRIRDFIGIIPFIFTLLIIFFFICDSYKIIYENKNVIKVVGNDVLRIREYNPGIPMGLLNEDDLLNINNTLIKEGYKVGTLDSVKVEWIKPEDISNGWVRIVTGSSSLKEIYELPVSEKNNSYTEEPVILLGIEAAKLMGIEKNSDDIGIAQLPSGFSKITNIIERNESYLINRTIYNLISFDGESSLGPQISPTILIKGVKENDLENVKSIIKNIIGSDKYEYLQFFYGGFVVDALQRVNNTILSFQILISIISLLEGFISFSNYLFLYSLLKRKESAILRALGASKSYVFKIFFIHHILLSLFALGLSFIVLSIFLLLQGTFFTLFNLYTMLWIILIIAISFILSYIFSISEARRIKEALPSRELKNL